MRKSIWLAVALLGASVQARAGAFMMSETSYNGKAPVMSRISIGSDAVKTEIQGEKGYTTVIFRGDKQLFWLIDDKDKSYREMTKEDAERMAAKMKDAQAQMAESMKNMSPEQKAMMEKYMGGKMGAAAGSALPKYVKKASGEKAGKWTADRYEAPKGKDGVRKLWTVPQGTIGLKAEDVAVLKEMAKFFEKFGANKSDYFQFDRQDMGIRGIPVKSLTIEGGKTTSSTILKEAGSKSFPSSAFDLPSGYSKKEMKGF